MSGRLADLARRYLPSGAVIVSALYLGSYVVGLLRERVLAGTFGAGAELDAYNAAFQLPELLFDVLVEAGLAAAFIPVFARLRSTEAGVADADRFARTVLTLSIVVMGVGSVLLFIFAEGTTQIIAPGFTGAQRELYLDLFRIMLVTQVLFAASLTLGQVLLADRRFFWFAVAPILYSTGIIVGTLAFSDAIGIYAAAVGAVFGAILHLGSRLVGLRGTSFRVGFDWELRTAQMGEFVRLTIPRLISQPIEPITFAFFTNLASRMAAGSLTVFNMARNFQSAPVTFVGASFAVAAFPALSTAYADGDRPTFLRLVGRNLVSIVALTRARVDRDGRPRRDRDRHPARRRGVRSRRCLADGRGPQRLRPLGPVREHLPAPEPCDLRHATHALPGARLDRRPARRDGRDPAAPRRSRAARAADRLRDRPGHEGRAAGARPRVALSRVDGYEPSRGVVGMRTTKRPSRSGYAPSGRVQPGPIDS